MKTASILIKIESDKKQIVNIRKEIGNIITDPVVVEKIK